MPSTHRQSAHKGEKMNYLITTWGRMFIGIPAIYYFSHITQETAPHWFISVYGLIIIVYICEPIFTKIVNVFKATKKKKKVKT